MTPARNEPGLDSAFLSSRHLRFFLTDILFSFPQQQNDIEVFATSKNASSLHTLTTGHEDIRTFGCFEIFRHVAIFVKYDSSQLTVLAFTRRLITALKTERIIVKFCLSALNRIL
jgi:hypothetical protein